jgi:hypothetical protein
MIHRMAESIPGLLESVKIPLQKYNDRAIVGGFFPAVRKESPN